MKQFFFFLLGSVLLWSCKDVPEQKQKQPEEVVLVFLDKSKSFPTSDSSVLVKYNGFLTELFANTIQETGDAVGLWLLHENTASARVFMDIIATQRKEDTSQNPTDQEAAEALYTALVFKEAQKINQKIMTEFQKENTSSSQKYTDIQASISVIESQKKPGTALTVVYLSDMVESVATSGRRDFHAHPPTSTTEAEIWAKADAKKISASLKDVKIRIVLPYPPTASSTENNPNISGYWIALFKELGVSDIVVE